MKQILFFLFLLLPALAFAQWPAAPNKIRLGNQTTGDGLIVRTDSIPDWTPADRNNAWLAFDTVAGVLYYYEGGVWNSFAGGGGSGMTSFDLAADTGTPETVGDEETATFVGGYGMNTDVGATRTVTFIVDTTEVATLSALSDSLATVVSGSGTLNTLPKWTPDGNTLGNSLITDDGARVSVGGTAGLVLPSGTTAQRSGAPVAGETRVNSTNSNTIEWYTGTAWAYPARTAYESGLFTAGRIPYAGAGGTLTDFSFFTFTPGRILIGKPSDYSTMINGGNSSATPLSTSSLTLIGEGAGNAVTTAQNVTAIGNSAARLLTSGNRITAIGSFAHRNGTTAVRNVAIGNSAMNNVTTGSDNVGIGSFAINAATTATANSSVGAYSGNYTTGSQNTYLGMSAGRHITSTSGNTILGFNSGRALTTSSNNVVVGANAANVTTVANSYTINTANHTNSTLTTDSVIVESGFVSGKLSSTGTVPPGLDTTTTYIFQVTGANTIVVRDGFTGSSYTGIVTIHIYNSFSNITVIGSNSSPTASNQVNIKNTIYVSSATGTGINISSGAKVGLKTDNPSDDFHVVGTARVTGSSTLPAASVTGRDSLGVFRDVTIGSGLSFSEGTLSATGPAAKKAITLYSITQTRDSVDSTPVHVQLTNVPASQGSWTYTDSTVTLTTGIYKVSFCTETKLTPQGVTPVGLYQLAVYTGETPRAWLSMTTIFDDDVNARFHLSATGLLNIEGTQTLSLRQTVSGATIDAQAYHELISLTIQEL